MNLYKDERAFVQPVPVDNSRAIHEIKEINAEIRQREMQVSQSIIEIDKRLSDSEKANEKRNKITNCISIAAIVIALLTLVVTIIK